MRIERRDGAVLVISRWAAPGRRRHHPRPVRVRARAAVGSRAAAPARAGARAAVAPARRRGVRRPLPRRLPRLAGAAVPALGGLPADPARDRGRLGGPRLRARSPVSERSGARHYDRRVLPPLAASPRPGRDRARHPSIRRTTTPTAPLRRPPPPRTWRERLEELADATGTTPGAHPARWRGSWSLAVARSRSGCCGRHRRPPEAALPFASTTVAWPGQHHHRAQRPRRPRGRGGRGARASTSCPPAAGSSTPSRRPGAWPPTPTAPRINLAAPLVDGAARLRADGGRGATAGRGGRGRRGPSSGDRGAREPQHRRRGCARSASRASGRPPPRPSSSTGRRSARSPRSTSCSTCPASARRSSRRSATWSPCERHALVL